MHLTLACPGLIPQHPFPAEWLEALAAPALQRWLTHGKHQRDPSPSPEQWLLTHHRLPADTGWAALSRAADGFPPDADSWLCADPIHLAVGRDGLRLLRPASSDLTLDEARQLAAALNQHFGQESAGQHAPQLQVATPTRWYLRCQEAPQLHTTPLAAAIGQRLEGVLPQGAQRRTWMRWLNEAQMLLEQHPLNQQRAAQGLMPLNSLWLWGEGTALPAAPTVPPERPIDSLSDDVLVGAVAQACGQHSQPLPPASAVPWSRLSPTPLLWLQGLREAAQSGDFLVWEQALLRLEQQWLAPLLALLAQGTLQRVTLLVPGQGQWTMGRRSHWAIWKRTPALAQQLAPIAPPEDDHP